MASLEGWSSTIELRPHFCAVDLHYMRRFYGMSIADLCLSAFCISKVRDSEFGLGSERHLA